MYAATSTSVGGVNFAVVFAVVFAVAIEVAGVCLFADLQILIAVVFAVPFAVAIEVAFSTSNPTRYCCRVNPKSSRISLSETFQIPFSSDFFSK